MVVSSDEPGNPPQENGLCYSKYGPFPVIMVRLCHPGECLSARILYFRAAQVSRPQCDKQDGYLSLFYPLDQYQASGFATDCQTVEEHAVLESASWLT